MSMEPFTPLAQKECALARAIETIGDKWTLLILRELFHGVGRFELIRRDTGASRAVLSQRLNDLMQKGVLRKAPYKRPGKRLRLEYLLTPTGRKLGVTLAALMEWGQELNQEEEKPRTYLYDAMSGEPVHLRFVTASGKIIASQETIRVKVGRKAVSSHKGVQSDSKRKERDIS